MHSCVFGGNHTLKMVKVVNHVSIFLKIHFSLSYVYVCGSVCVMHIHCVCAHRCPWMPEASGPLELELQVVVSCLS